ncbi:MAG: hypothetical protein ABDI20_08580, partial [Candidatus Bipolaricaulaceae bacterium]
MRWSFACLGFLLFLGLLTSSPCLGESCTCDAEAWPGDPKTKSISIGFTGVIVKLWEILGVKVGFSITIEWDKQQDVKQECKCYHYCCPDENVVTPFVRLDPVVFEVEEPDPLVPTVPRWKEVIAYPVPEPIGTPHWDCVDCKKPSPPRVCVGTWRRTYARAGVFLSLQASVGIGPTISLPLLKTGGSELRPTPGPCRLEMNRPPRFIAIPSGVCLYFGQEVELTFVVYDPNGPQDLVGVEPSDPWPAEVMAVPESKSRKEVPWTVGSKGEAPLTAIEVRLRIKVDERYKGYKGGELRFEAKDAQGSLDLAVVPLEVIEPVQITREEERKYWEWTTTKQGKRVQVLAQEFTLVIKDPNPPLGYAPRFTYCVRLKKGTGLLLLNRMSDVRCGASFFSTQRIAVTFIPDPEAAGQEDEVIVEVSHYRCGTLFVNNGFPVKAVVNTAPEVTVVPAEIRAVPGQVVSANVVAIDPDGDQVVLRKTGGPGSFPTVEGFGRVQGVWTWTVPDYLRSYAGYVSFAAADIWSAGYGFLYVRT